MQAHPSMDRRPPDDTAGTYANPVRGEQVRLLYEGLPVSVLGSTVAALLAVAILWNIAPRIAMLVWFAIMLANQAWRLALFLAYRRRGGLQPTEVKRWATYWVAGSGLSGCIWGAASFFLFAPGEPVAQAVLIVLIFGVTSAAVMLTGSYLPAFYAFVVPALLPVVLRSLWEGERMHYALALVALLSMLAVMSFGRNYNRALTRSLRDRFHNEHLAQQLARQNTELEIARKVAEDASRAKTQFFAAASHDLRQPLHAMGLFASALANKAADPESRKLVASIDDSVHALEGLFNELLDISRLDSGSLTPVISDFVVDEVLDRLRGEFAAEAAAKGLQFAIVSCGAAVLSDPVLLERIVRNLGANALRYTAAGEVSVIVERTNGAVRIAVRDTGMGIAIADQQRIFEEFTQLQNPARTSKKGLGLGLSIVKRLCDLLGYHITLESKTGAGSTFSFEVPVGTMPAQRAGTGPTPAATRADLTGRLVVVIDDEEAIVAGMAALLEGWGAEVIGSTAGNGVVQQVHAAGRLPDLLLIDFRLDGEDTGIHLAGALRKELDPEIPAVLVTGSITPDLEARAHAAGLAYLLKPVTAGALARCIESLLPVRLS